MLHRKIYQMCQDGCDVSVFLRDQQRWIEDAQIIALEGDVVSIRYEMEEDYETSSWEEIVRLESIGAISCKLASVPRGDIEVAIADECPEAEQIHPRHPEQNQD